MGRDEEGGERLVPAGAGARAGGASGGGAGRERSNAGEVEFMGERQAKAHMNGNGVSAEGRALPLRFDAAPRVVSTAWLGRSATHVLHELFSAAAARWHVNMA